MEVKLLGLTVPILDGEITLEPEAICASIARLSHDRRNMKPEDLLKESIENVAKAKQSNENIIFGFGHNSVAEMIDFVFGIEGISRADVEIIQSFSRTSGVERSQRYIKMEDKVDWVIPTELNPIKEQLISKYNKQLELYLKETENESKNTEVLEDKRKLLPLAMPTRLGIKMNARQLEYMISALGNIKTSTIQDLRTQLFDCVKQFNSIIKYTKPLEQYECPFFCSYPTLDYVDFTKTINEKYDTFEVPKYGYKVHIHGMNYWVAKHFKKWQGERHRPQSFAIYPISIKVENMDGYTFGQWKRHRYFETFSLGYETFSLIKPYNVGTVNFTPHLKAYCCINDDKRHVISHTNLRELLHFDRIRNDKHAQENIKLIAKGISDVIHKY